MKEKIIERYRVYLQCADRSIALRPTKAMFDFKYAWLLGAYNLATELGCDAADLGESPNQWAERHRSLCAA